MKILKFFGLALFIALLIFCLIHSKILSKNTRTEEVNANNIRYIKTEDIKIDTNNWKSSHYGCLKLFLSDSFSSISALAINEKYLAVGDSEKNIITIYNHKDDGKWLKTKEILPPKDSITHKVGSGFGSALALDNNLLIIGAYTEQLTSKVTNPNDFQERSISTSISQEIYTTILNNPIINVERVQVTQSDIVDSYSITANENKVAFIPSQQEKIRQNFNQVIVLSMTEKTIRRINVPQPEPERKFNLPFDIALQNNLLLVGSPSVHTNDSGWLFDLDAPNKKPIRLTAPNAALGNTVALSEEFAVVGALSEYGLVLSPKTVPKTLIRAIKNGSSVVIDGYGELSLDKNILLRKQRGKPGTSEKGAMEVFRLLEDGTPLLQEKSTDYITAFLQNGFLLTTQEITSGVKICTQQID